MYISTLLTAFISANALEKLSYESQVPLVKLSKISQLDIAKRNSRTPRVFQTKRLKYAFYALPSSQSATSHYGEIGIAGRSWFLLPSSQLEYQFVQFGCRDVSKKK